MYARHNAIASFLERKAIVAGYRTSREVTLPDNRRPADLLVWSWPSPGRATAVDVVVTHPLALSHPLQLVKDGMELLNREEAAKIEYYSGECGMRKWRFEPVALSTFGRQGASTERFLRELFRASSAQLPTEVERQVAIFQSLQQLQVVLKREVARMLAAGVNTDNLDALQEEVDRVDYATSEAARETEAAADEEPIEVTGRRSWQYQNSRELPQRCNSPVEGLIDQLGNCLLGEEGDGQDEAVKVVV
jgi:hypothetical protein